MSMHEQIVSTYRSLMTSLATLPDEIGTAQADLTDAKIALVSIDKALDAVEAETALTIEGKNAEERKARLTQTLRTLPAYVGAERIAIAQRSAVAGLTNDVDNLTRQFVAVGYAAKLHAALMAYLTEAAPGKEFNVTFGADNAIAVNGNGNITAADAAELGL